MRFIVVIFLFFKLSAFGQGAFFTSGTDFLIPIVGAYQTGMWTSFLDTSSCELVITAIERTCVYAKITNAAFDTILYLDKDSTAILILPYLETRVDTGALNNNIISIKSTYPIQVVYYTGISVVDTAKHSAKFIGDNKQYENMAISPSKKADDYYLLNIPNDSATSEWYRQFHEYWLLSSKDQEVSIKHYSYSRWQSKPIGVPFTIQFDSLNYYSDYTNGGGVLIPPRPFSNNRGYTGNIYLAQKPKSLFLFGGAVNVNASTCDINPAMPRSGWECFEQSKPVNYADTLYFANQLNDSYTNLYSVLAVEDSTTIYGNGTLFKTIQKGTQLDTCLPGDVVFKSSKPTLLTLTRVGIGPYLIADSVLYISSSEQASFSVTMPSANETIKRSIVYAPYEGYNATHTVALFTKTTDTSLVFYNGSLLPNGSWQTFSSNQNYSFAQVDVPFGYNNFTTTGQGFFGYHYSLMKKTQGYAFMPSRGTALIEAISWPEDSILNHIGPDASNLQSFANYTSPICVGQSLLVQPNHARYTTWQISWDNGQDTSLYATSNPAAGATLTFLTIGQFWLTIKDSAGCSAPDSVLITVLPNPQAQFTAQTQAACQGTFVQLQNQSTGASNYSWQWPGGSSTDANPQFLYTGADSTLTIILVATEGICADTTTQSIALNNQTFDSSKIPNVFSPNADGVNDAFCIPSTAGFTDCFLLTIYNRWGSQVFVSQNPENCWEATNTADGVYFYTLLLGTQKYNGSVTVSR